MVTFGGRRNDDEEDGKQVNPHQEVDPDIPKEAMYHPWVVTYTRAPKAYPFEGWTPDNDGLVWLQAGDIPADLGDIAPEAYLFSTMGISSVDLARNYDRAEEEAWRLTCGLGCVVSIALVIAGILLATGVIRI